MGLGCRAWGFMGFGFRALGFMGFGFRASGFMGLGFMGLWFKGLGFRALGFMGLGRAWVRAQGSWSVVIGRRQGACWYLPGALLERLQSVSLLQSPFCVFVLFAVLLWKCVWALPNRGQCNSTCNHAHLALNPAFCALTHWHSSYTKPELVS